MSDNKNVNKNANQKNSNQKNSNQKNSVRKPEGDSAVDAVVKKSGSWFRNIYGEFKKIIWPDRKDLVKHTVNVIIVSLAIGAVIVAMDFVFSTGYTALIGVFS